MYRQLLLAASLLSFTLLCAQNQLKINDKGYFEMPGLNVTVFSDIYPDGHQTGVTVIQHGSRVAANGDLRLEASPGQWSPVPTGGKLSIDEENQTIKQRLWYPDSTKNKKGFNPIDYPDLVFSYDVEVKADKGSSFLVSVNLDEPLPEEWIGKVGFNFEIFPSEFFGKSWIMDAAHGIFYQQPNGPIISEHGEHLGAVLASGKKLTIAPETDLQRMTIVSQTGTMDFLDGRTNHNNGWFIVREKVKSGATKNAVQWKITPNAISTWQYQPVIQVSQLGYHIDQEKKAIIEMDANVSDMQEMHLFKLAESGKTLVKSGTPKSWGNFLRYKYGTFDFSEINTQECIC